MKTMPRRGEFSLATKDRVIRRGVCAECGGEYDPKDPWHIHHIIFIDSVIGRTLPDWILSCIANAELLHKGCHNHIHNVLDEPTDQDVNRVLQKTGEPIPMFANR